jgi:hypothetical protein
MIGRYRSKFK